MSEQVRGMFAGIAERYDLANRVLSAGRDVAWRRRALASFTPPPSVLLDLACGTYDCALDALQLGAAERVHGADFCLPMLQAGSEKRRGRPVSASAGDALRLPFADASFDGAIMAYGWRNLDDPVAGLVELRRVLRPGGQLVLLEFFKPSRWWPAFFYGSFGRLVFPLIGGLLTGRTAAYRYLHSSIQAFLTTSEADAALRQAGFADPRWTTCFGGISHFVHARLPALAEGPDAC